jgi:hypothetical protein
MKVKNEVYQYLYKRDKPASMKIMGIIVALFSIGGLASSPVFGILMVLAAGGLLSYQRGIEINFEERNYRLITAFGTQGFGEWQQLPEIKCVSVFKTTLTSRTYGRSNASVTSTESVIQVNLATIQNTRIRLLETEDLDEAFAFAKEVSCKLNLPIWDASAKEGSWMD